MKYRCNCHATPVTITTKDVIHIGLHVYNYKTGYNKVFDEDSNEIRVARKYPDTFRICQQPMEEVIE